MGGDDDGRRRSHCGGGRRSVVRTKTQLLIVFAKNALRTGRMAWALFAVRVCEEFTWWVYTT